MTLVTAKEAGTRVGSDTGLVVGTHELGTVPAGGVVTVGEV